VQLIMREEQSENLCSAVVAIELLQGKWRIRILCAMRNGPVRLGQLTRLIPTASKKVLTENLRKLESSGLIVRSELSGAVRHVKYELAGPTRIGTQLLLDQLGTWVAQLGEGRPPLTFKSRRQERDES
jgi:DNA-binding HxlR family transcriptional regulator